MYRWIDHTAEVEVAIEGGSEREVFEDAVQALAELLGFGAAGPGDARRRVSAAAPDLPTLLAAWLEELVYLAEAEGFVAVGIDDLSLAPEDAAPAGASPGDAAPMNVAAIVAGVQGDPPPIVKAVTYHRLAFEPAGDGYVANVVLDV